MDTFVISPTESLLLGLCLEEYLHCWRCFGGASFIHFLNVHLKPFTPEMRQFRGPKVVDEASLPADVEWLSPDHQTVGFSKSEPAAGFARVEGRLYKALMDTSRLSLPQLVAQLLDGCISRSAFDSLEYPPKCQQSSLREYFWIRGVASSQDGEAIERISERSGSEDPAEVETRLVRLVEANEYTRSFLVGRRLGTLFGLCAQLREVDFDTDYRPKYHISETDFAVRVGEVAKELCAMPEMAGCTYAGLLLQRLAVNRVSRLDLDGPPEVSLWAGEIAPAGGDAEDDEAGPLERLVDCCEPGRRYAVLIDHIRQVAGVALGELLGTLKDADVEVQEKDIRSATPRMFPLSRDAPAERVRGQVYLIERELNDRTASGMLPENAVAMLGAAPEALAKQLWPDTFAAAGPRDGVMQILAEKARLSSDENTRKFAQNALHLYKTYRNPAVHNLATYECSWEEARFFLNGIRVLLDLHDRIKAANDLSSPP